MSARRKPLFSVLALVATLVAATSASAAGSPPASTSPPVVSGTAQVGQTLTTSNGTWSGAPTRFAYTWRQCNAAGGQCSVIANATSATYVVQPADVGHRIRSVVRATNAYGHASARSGATPTVNSASTADTSPPTAPSNLHTAGSTQNSIAAAWNASSDNVGVAGYHATLNGAAAGDSSSTTYAFGGLHCGTTYTLGVSAYDAAGNASAVSTISASTTACSAAPSNTAPPAVSGRTQVGQTLSTSNGTWSGTTPMTYTYQWQDCDSAGANCSAISGATGSTYALTGADQGHTVRSRVTAANSTGSAAASSAQTAVVQPAAAPSSGGLSVSGNHLVDANGTTVQLHGVNYSGTEYACIQGWGIFDGPSDANSVRAIASWHSNIVHIGLNEDCILGINGVPAAYAGANYMNAIQSYVNLLHANGLYAEVSLMWAAPGTNKALGHPQILDQDHAPAALKVIANTFKDDPKTIIGLQSEPHDIGWACWRNGGSSCSVGYAALGMQGALDAVRSTGATNTVTASGISYANDLSQWLANEPSDPLGQLVAEAHVYGGNSCASVSCFNASYAPVVARVPVIFGETGETYDDSSCGSTNISTFMNWADSNGVGYESWVWDTWGTCGSLIKDFNGTPANAYAQWVHDHYVARFP